MDVQCFGPAASLGSRSTLTSGSLEPEGVFFVFEARLKMKKVRSPPPPLNLAALNKLSNKRLAVLTFSFLAFFFFVPSQPVFAPLSDGAMYIPTFTFEKSPMKADAVLL